MYESGLTAPAACGMIPTVAEPNPPDNRTRSFSNPPVVETVLGLQFEPISGFTNAHLGLFWGKLGGRLKWPFASDEGALGQEFERFGEDLDWTPINSARFRIGHAAATRARLWNEDKSRLLQFQNGRLIYNWLGKGNDYPRYEKIKLEFDGIIERFMEFLAQESLPAVSPNQWEITYVNHLPKETVWHNVTDWSRVFSFDAVPPASVGACRLEHFGGQWSYEIEPHRGRLHVQLQNGKDSNTSDVLVLNLSARGPIGEGSGAVENLSRGLDLGHEVIINAFNQLTSKHAQAHWETERH